MATSLSLSVILVLSSFSWASTPKSLVHDLHLSAPHPIHVSITDINYAGATHTLEISVRIFIDDLELAIQQEYKTGALFLATAKEHAQAEKWMKQYIQKHVGINIVGQNTLQWKYIGRETENDAIWLYYEIPNINPFNALTIKNSVLVDQYDDQSNIINVKATGGKIHSVRTRRGSETETVSW